RLLRYRGDPPGGAELIAAAAGGQRFRSLDRELVARLQSAGDDATVDQDQELVAAEAVGGGRWLNGRLQASAQHRQHLVPGRVAEGVVVALEAVEVEEDHGQRRRRRPFPQLE